VPAPTTDLDVWEDEGVPPPPDNFPPDWDESWQPSFETAEMASRPEPTFKSNEAPTPSKTIKPDVVVTPIEDDMAFETEESVKPEDKARDKAALSARVPSLYASITEKRSDHSPQQIVINLRSTGDKERDKRRIRNLFNTFISFYGDDRFSFQIFEGGKGNLIDFPSYTTMICPELLGRLKKLLGEESWDIDEITFQ